MKEHLRDQVHSLSEFLTHLFINHPEGMFLYMFAALTINLLNLVYKREWDEGSKGANKLWDIPEQLVVVGPKWLYPHILAAAVFLPEVVKVPEWAAWFMAGNTFFALAGRAGLEWIAAMKGVAFKSTESVQSTVVIKEKTSSEDEIK